MREERNAIRDGYTENFNYNGNVFFLCLVGENRGSLYYSLYVYICLKYFIRYTESPPKKQDEEKKVNLTFFHHHHRPPHQKHGTILDGVFCNLLFSHNNPFQHSLDQKSVKR